MLIRFIKRSFGLLFAILLFMYFVYSSDKSPFFIIFILSVLRLGSSACMSCDNKAISKYNRSCEVKNSSSKESLKISPFNIIYISLIFVPLINLKKTNPDLVLWLFLMIWPMKLFSYSFIEFMKNKKYKIKKYFLNKAYEEMIFGVLGSILIGLFFAHFKSIDNPLPVVLVSCILGQISYPIEAIIKYKLCIDDNVIMSDYNKVASMFDGLLLPSCFMALFFGL